MNKNSWLMLGIFQLGMFLGAASSQGDAHNKFLNGETHFWFYDNHKIVIRVMDTTTVSGKFKAHKDGYGIH